jgi:hypothetical protein
MPHLSTSNAQNSTVASQTLLVHVVTAVKPSVMFYSQSVTTESLYAMTPNLISDSSSQGGIYQQDDLTRTCLLLPEHPLVL